jgi:hypothetical protein
MNPEQKGKLQTHKDNLFLTTRGRLRCEFTHEDPNPKPDPGGNPYQSLLGLPPFLELHLEDDHQSRPPSHSLYHLVLDIQRRREGLGLYLAPARPPVSNVDLITNTGTNVTANLHGVQNELHGLRHDRVAHKDKTKGFQSWHERSKKMVLFASSIDGQNAPERPRTSRGFLC